MYDILMKAMSYVAIIVLGYVLRRRGFFGPEAFGILSKIVIRITLPCALISSAAGKPIDLSYLTICLLGLGFGLTYMALGWLLKRRAAQKGGAAYMAEEEWTVISRERADGPTVSFKSSRRQGTRRRDDRPVNPRR